MRTSWRHLFSAVLAACLCGALPQYSTAGLIVTEQEPNTTFSTREQLPRGTMGVQGALGSGSLNADFSFSDALSPNVADFFTISGQLPGRPFRAWTDNSASGTDTVLATLGIHQDPGSIIDTDDDSGGGLASALNGVVQGDGSINLGVSGFSDFGFVGDHSQQGEYDLFVSYDTGIEGDVDIFQFNGLAAGYDYVAEVTSASFDTVLGLISSAGGIIETDDDGGVGLLSRLEFEVSAEGTAIIALTAYSDFSFNGDHTRSGDYALSFVPVVPEPASAAIWGAGAIALTLIRRRKR